MGFNSGFKGLISKGIFRRHTWALYICICVCGYALVCRLLWSCVVIEFLVVIVEIRPSGFTNLKVINLVQL